MPATILAIESSCDESAAALLRGGKLLSHTLATQQVHAAYGGVVPELAARAHIQHIVPTVAAALQQAGLALEEVSHVAFTQGPGLLGSLLVGACFAKGLALARQRPLLGVNHIHAHLMAAFLEAPQPPFPFLGLVVSGGHTQLLLVQAPLRLQLLGQTRDDAIGEAFDKVAKLMGLPYPGGPLVDRYAQKGDPKAFAFPKAQMPGLDFSFSGIKTAFLRFMQQQKQPRLEGQLRADVCASVQHTLVEMVAEKVRAAVARTGVSALVMGGGVAANSALRTRLQGLGQAEGWQLFVPRRAYCTDNAAMVAVAAHFQLQAGIRTAHSVPCLPRMAC